MIDKLGKELARNVKNCIDDDDWVDDNYWELVSYYDDYMNKLNGTKNERYSFDGSLLIYDPFVKCYIEEDRW